ncbi:hypothetical protein HMPREF0975_00670 [Actinomyces sp. oral taxon 849 str. F0330]|mgnify:CR=1 FL=1|jgi:hypothetical protein|uniref:hypothetical protein n=1 Tax=Actinomyces sp. oral taxon 849 TaxID=653385 RepID=UPI000242FD0D|nr:hypothetical protein [Actinomyces sp. oral taxon 849]EHM95266.1 hypothetical protein HMPREF0975_00670 [Actinomyces sp. oral taxon 849 str. F0330]
MLSKPDTVPVLVREAFLQALRKGKKEWWRMNMSVLNNRMIQINRDVRNKIIGDQNIVHWAQLQPYLKVETGELGATVELIDDARREIVDDGDYARLYRGQRIRGDLWSAVMNKDSEVSHCWDRGVVSQCRSDSTGLVLPKLSEEDLRRFRREFADQHPERSIQKWVDDYRYVYLLREIRGEWYEYLKSKVFDILNHWFEENAIDPPKDMLTPIADRKETKNSSLSFARDKLRSLIDVATEQELSMIMIPAGLVARVWSNE